MPYLVTGLAAAVASFLVTAFSSKPAITVETSKTEDSAAKTMLFKWGFYLLAGMAALQLLKKVRKG